MSILIQIQIVIDAFEKDERATNIEQRLTQKAIKVEIDDSR